MEEDLGISTLKLKARGALSSPKVLVPRRVPPIPPR